MEKAARDLRLCFPPEQVKLSLPQIPPSSDFFPAFETVKEHLQTLLETLEKQAERAETIELCRQRALEMQEQMKNWGKAAPANSDLVDQDCVLWVEAYSSSLQLHRTPLSIAPIFNKQREDSARSWIFTSATLAVKNDFSHYTAQMGLSEEKAVSWPSPFDYANQGLLYIPTGMPEPRFPGYTDAVVNAALPVLIASGGRAFLLCTTLRAVKQSAERLREEFAQRGLTFSLFVQGESGRTELLDQFRRSGNGILIGSQSFWEGIDVRGEALSLVVIDKLPFAPPDDPVLAARINAMEKLGKNGFVHHQLPEAIINLKQGAGRLIRDETDKGVLMLCDPRILSKPYGARVWQSMPPFTRTRELKVVEDFFLSIKDTDNDSSSKQ
jgi:ATP-dependent DNA helicase DinG